MTKDIIRLEYWDTANFHDLSAKTPKCWLNNAACKALYLTLYNIILNFDNISWDIISKTAREKC